MTSNYNYTFIFVIGMTVKKAVISLKSIFKEGMAYVALSRVSSIAGLFLRDFDEKKIYCPPHLQQYLQHMDKLIISKELCPLLHEDGFVVAFHNIQSFHAHKADLIRNLQMTIPKILGLSEVWLTNDHPNFAIPGYKLILAEQRDRGGVGFCVHQSLEFNLIHLPTTTACDVLAIKVYNPDMTVCVVYRKPSSRLTDFNKDLSAVINQLPDEHVVIGGDFNRNTVDEPEKIVFKPLQLKRFIQIIDKPTTTSGSLIDHIYIKNNPNSWRSGVIPTYYSYHEAVYYAMDK